MKKIFLLCLTTFLIVAANAQPVTSLSENFNASCNISSPHYPAGWNDINIVAGTIPDGIWTCGPVDGKDGQPCIECTGYYGGTYHVDTAFLITPELNLTGYTGNVYLNFDTKVSYIYTGVELSVLQSYDSTFAIDTALGVTPEFGVPDSSDWVTHQVNITGFKGMPFYIGFRYTSPIGYGSTWYIDNINTTTTPLGVKNTISEKLPLTIVGNSTSDNISFSCSVNTAGIYNVALYDITGRCISSEIVNYSSGTNTHHINGLNLASGMYFLKVGNETAYGATKLVVQ